MIDLKTIKNEFIQAVYDCAYVYGDGRKKEEKEILDEIGMIETLDNLFAVMGYVSTTREMAHSADIGDDHKLFNKQLYIRLRNILRSMR